MILMEKVEGEAIKREAHAEKREGPSNQTYRTAVN
jgi:hypothetical protein